MKFKCTISLILLLTFCTILFISCGSSNEMQDGFYTAEMSEFSHGWKEYICILVKNNIIISAEYNARDESGFIKAWDNEYMKNMNSIMGTYPNAYTREYVKQFIDKQSADNIDTVSGASHSGENFRKLILAAMEQAKKGDSETAVIK